MSAFQYPSFVDRYNPLDVTPTWATNVGNETSIIPSNVDIVMIHGPAKYVLDLTDDNSSAGCEHLRREIARVKPRLRCFGYIHQRPSGFYETHRLEYDEGKELPGDLGINRVKKDYVGKGRASRDGFRRLSPGDTESFCASKQTLCVNAAMEGEKGVLEHPPWLVNLDLPVPIMVV